MSSDRGQRDPKGEEGETDLDVFVDCFALTTADLLSNPEAADLHRPKIRMEGLNVGSEEFEKLVKTIQCSVCSNPCSGPLKYICAEGHMTCGSCSPTVVTICSQPIGYIDGEEYGCCGLKVDELYEPMHDHIIEKYKLIVRCDFWKLGCSVKDDLKEVKAHWDVCPYRRELGCPYIDCEDGGFNVPELVTHLSEAHGSILVDLNQTKQQTGGNKMIMKKSSEEQYGYGWIPGVFKFSKYHFLLTVESRERKMRVWIYELDRSDKEFDIQIHLQRGDAWEAWSARPIDYLIPHERVRDVFQKDRDEFMKAYTQPVEGEDDLFQICVSAFF